MPIDKLNESVARNRELSKSPLTRRLIASTVANAQAVAMPMKKSAVVVNTTVLTVFRLIQISTISIAISLFACNSR